MITSGSISGIMDGIVTLGCVHLNGGAIEKTPVLYGIAPCGNVATLKRDVT